MNEQPRARVAVIGAGPAGLMAAEVLSCEGVEVHVYDAMPTAGRKFLLAGLGGLNLTHAEAQERFVLRYGERSHYCAAWLKEFDAQAVCEWARGLGVDTFVGTSQRVFPVDMKAAPLLRAWLQRLRRPLTGAPVQFHMRSRWRGDCSAGHKLLECSFDTPSGVCTTQANAVVLALGGGSWARLGSDGAWQPRLEALGVQVTALRPSNCGFDVQGAHGVGWSEHFASRFAGHAFKSVTLTFTDSLGQHFEQRGEFVATSTGIEGSLVYSVSARLRDEIARCGAATLYLNLRPDLSPERVLAEVSHPRGSRSLSSHLKSRLKLTSLHLGLLHEQLSRDAMHDPVQLASAVGRLPLTLCAPRPLEEAISSAGGVRLEALSDQLMTRAVPGLFAAGEMLDWEAPTGGYLLTACLASGRTAARGVIQYLNKRNQ